MLVPTPLHDNRLIHGDALLELERLPANSVDLVFADPPYNLQLKGALLRPNHTQVDAVTDDWDQFDSFKAYDEFTRAWLQGVRRVMKPSASIWVSGTYHNIFRVGTALQNMGFWILNTITWLKHNAMPNFRGTRLKNDVEYVIWAKYDENSRYTFHHHLMKRFNDFSPNKQLGSVWQIPSTGGAERLRATDGQKLHPTQKPEELLKRIILASSKPDDWVLDPFAGTGTTPAMARHLRRHYIAIEQDNTYYEALRERVEATQPLPKNHALIRDVYHEKPPRVAFKTLLNAGYLRVGQTLYHDDPVAEAVVTDNAKLRLGDETGSIHQLCCLLKDVPSSNGWKHWYYEAADGKRKAIDNLRHQYASAKNT